MIAAVLQLTAFALVTWGLSRGVDWVYRRNLTAEDTGVVLVLAEETVPARALTPGRAAPSVAR